MRVYRDEKICIMSGLIYAGYYSNKIYKQQKSTHNLRLLKLVEDVFVLKVKRIY